MNDEDNSESHKLIFSKKLKNVISDITKIDIRDHLHVSNNNNTRSGTTTTAFKDKIEIDQQDKSNKTDNDTKLYGRKGSVSLRIFHNQDKSSSVDGEGGVTDNNNNSNNSNNSSIINTPVIEEPEHRDEIPYDNDDRNSQTIKRISSATYYPHALQNVLITPSTTTTTTTTTTTKDNKDIQEEHEEEHEKHEKHEKHERHEEEQEKDNKEEDQEDEDEDAIEYSENESTDNKDTYEYPLAVELQPFKNKVGGHTEIFKFSERAVCKTLVNNENKWYENLEQLSKDETISKKNILQYMPKYIGVLNVRQHFNTLKEYMEVVGEFEDKNMKLKSKNDNNNNNNNNTTTNANTTNSTDTNTATPAKKGRCYSDTINEVVIDDNMHLFSNSLLNKFNTSVPIERRLSNSSLNNGLLLPLSLSSSPTSTTSLLLTSPKADSLKLHHTQSQNNLCENNSIQKTTMLNTKLQEQIINEVFAPLHKNINNKLNRRIHRNSNGHHNTNMSNTTINGSGHSRFNNSQVSVNDILQTKKRRQSDSAHTNLRRYSSLNSSSFVDCQKEAQDDDDDDDDDNNNRTNSNNNVFLPDSPLMEPQRTTTPAQESLDLGTLTKTHTHDDYTIVSQFILLEDLTRNLENPCVLDLKMGTRQYGVNANVRKQKSQGLKCLKTTSRKLGCRVCGLKIWNPLSKKYVKRDKYFGRRIKRGWQFTRILSRFLYNMQSVDSILYKIPSLIENLDNLIETVMFLKGYRLYGASLLFMYDGAHEYSNCKIYLIDFAQCLIKQDFENKKDQMMCPPKTSIQWEDKGFVKGLKSLKFYLKTIWNYLTNDHELIFDNEKLMHYLQKERLNSTAPLGKCAEGNWDWLDEFDSEDELEFNDENSKLRKKWMKYELIFDVEPPFENNDESS